jgi:hypothetical protein
MLSKDEEFQKNFSEMTAKGKEKLNALFEVNEDGEGLADKIKQKAKYAKEELELHIESLVKKLYDKMQIAHLEKIEELQMQIDVLKKELSLAEGRIVQLESK